MISVFGYELIHRIPFFEHMRNLRGGYNVKKYITTKFIFPANSLEALKGNDFVYKDDYYFFNDKMQLIMLFNSNYSFRRNVFLINHNTIKYLLKNNIINHANDSSMATINLLYK